jgi:hypothetical protein
MNAELRKAERSRIALGFRPRTLYGWYWWLRFWWLA